MTNKTNSNPTGSRAKEVVRSFIKSMNEEDFKAARDYVNDDMTFEGVLGSRTERKRI